MLEMVMGPDVGMSRACRVKRTIDRGFDCPRYMHLVSKLEAPPCGAALGRDTHALSVAGGGAPSKVRA